MRRWLIAALCVAGCADPAGPTGLRSYLAIATGGDHTCAVDQDGAAYCWGSNRDGELGTGDHEDAFVPTRVKSDVVFRDITAGASHSCALAEDGRVFCWGWQAFYQLGLSQSGDGTIPQQIESDQRFTAVSAGAQHTCALALGGRVFCWGYNRHGQNGNGKTVTTVPPAPVVGDFRATQISAGGDHTCALTTTRVAVCWGRNDYGQLGIGSDTLGVHEPTAVKTSLRFTAIDAGARHTCGIANELAYCWGSAIYGEIGDAAPYREGLPGPASPVPVLFLSSVSEIAAGTHQSCAVDLLSGTSCWGLGTSGQLGTGSALSQPVPGGVLLRPRHPLPFAPLAPGGATHACGINTGAVYCWGTGRSGQLGAGPNTFSVLPQRIRDR